MLDNTNTTQPTHVILVPGFWLGAWAWDQVVDHLPSDLLAIHAITPLGLDHPAGSEQESMVSVTLEAQIEDLVARVDRLISSSPGRIVLVGHSGGGPLVQGVTDRRPGSIDRVVYVDSGPLLDGTSMSDVTGTPPDDADRVPLPDWSEWQESAGALEGLDETMRAEFRRRASPEPAGVARSVVQLGDPARLTVPATVICTSIPSDQLRQLIAAGHLPSEISEVGDVTYLDLPTGHWPMFTRPADLADIIASEALRT